MSQTILDNRTLVAVLIDAIGNRGELDRIPDVFADGWLDHSVWSNPIADDGMAVGDDPVPTSLDDTRHNVALMRLRFPGLHTVVDKLIDAGDHVVVVSTTSATHRSGTQVCHRGIEIHRIGNGRIVESWSAWDRLGLGQQLGLIAPTSELWAREAAPVIAADSAVAIEPDPAVAIEPLAAGDEASLAAALAVLDDGVGTGAYTLTGLRAAAGAADKAVLLARADDAVVGVLVVELITGDRRWYERFGPCGHGRVAAAHRPGNLSGAAVVPDWRRRGVATALAAAGLRWLEAAGCDLAVVVSWLHPGDGTSLRLIDQAGFSRVARADDVYLEDSLHNGLVCTYCAGPCHCAGLLCVRPLGAPDPLDPRTQHPFWEIAHDPMYALLELHDQDGRPLGERTSSPAAQVGVEMEVRRCPYPGSRRHHDQPMNVSALRQATAVWDDVLDAIHRVRWALGAAQRPGLFTAWQCARALATAPGYLVRQGQPVPGPVASAYKVSLGIAQACEGMLLAGIASGVAPFEPVAAAAVHQFTEDRGLFVSIHGVCSGSPVMVTQTLGAFLDDIDAPAGSPGAVAGRLGDLDRFAAWTRVEAAGYLVKVALLAAVHDARIARGAAPGRPAVLRLAQLAQMLEPLPPPVRGGLAVAAIQLAATLVPAAAITGFAAAVGGDEPALIAAGTAALAAVQRAAHVALDGPGAPEVALPAALVARIPGEVA